MKLPCDLLCSDCHEENRRSGGAPECGRRAGLQAPPRPRAGRTRRPALRPGRAARRAGRSQAGRSGSPRSRRSTRPPPPGRRSRGRSPAARSASGNTEASPTPITAKPAIAPAELPRAERRAEAGGRDQRAGPARADRADPLRHAVGRQPPEAHREVERGQAGRGQPDGGVRLAPQEDAAPVEHRALGEQRAEGDRAQRGEAARRPGEARAPAAAARPRPAEAPGGNGAAAAPATATIARCGSGSTPAEAASPPIAAPLSAPNEKAACSELKIRLPAGALHRQPLDVHRHVEHAVGGAHRQGAERERRRVDRERGGDAGEQQQRSWPPPGGATRPSQ